MSNRSRILAPSDVPHALEMSRLVGWNQTTEDWLLAIRMNPQGCFAMEVDGMVVATTTSIRYGTDLAWIGMVLTHPEFRGRGFARTLMEQVLDHLSDVQTVKLDATEMGMPLYRQLGFADDGTIERWLRPAQITATAEVDPFTPSPDLDKQAFGADRSALLRQLATIEAASLGDAFAMGRGSRLGPCVSRSKEAAQALAQWYLAKHPNQLILWDLLPENNLAQSLGFEHYRTLTRMTRGNRLHRDNSLIYAGAGFEFG
jgi:GNAT superfamily N-acetyltransferase